MFLKPKELSKKKIEYCENIAFPKNKRISNNKLLKDKKGKCEICGKSGQTEKHHIKTKGASGSDIKENLIEVCRTCHTKIHTGEIKI